MKTSTFLTISTSVLLGALDVSSALSPPPRDDSYSSSARGLYPSKTYTYNFATQSPASTRKSPVYTETPKPIVKEYPYVVEPQELGEFPEFPDILDRPSTGDSEISEIYDPIPIPDEESPDITDPPPIPHPQIPTKGYYELPNGTVIAVELRESGYGQNPKPVKDYDHVSRIDNPSPVRHPQPPPPFPGDLVYGDGIKNFPDPSTIIDEPPVDEELKLLYGDGVNHIPVTLDPALEHLVEFESPLLVSDVTGEDPSQKIANRDLGDLKDLADDVLADFKKKYEALKSDVDDFKFPDFGDLSKYLPSGVDVDVDFDASKIPDFPSPLTDTNFQISTFVEPIPDGEVIVDSFPKGEVVVDSFPKDRVIEEPIPHGETIEEPIPHGETIEEPIPPRFSTLPRFRTFPAGFHTLPAPRSYAYQITVSASPPAPTTFATLTRPPGSARPSSSVDYKFTLSV